MTNSCKDVSVETSEVAVVYLNKWTAPANFIRIKAGTDSIEVRLAEVANVLAAPDNTSR